MNVEFPCGGLQNLPLLKLTILSKHLEAANSLKSGIATQRFTSFGHQLQPARSRESHGPDLLANDTGIVE